ncbi:MAG: diguanylate cyclase [Burkholderiales bacterium]
MTALTEIKESDHLSGTLDFSVRLMEHLVVPTFVINAECRVIIWNRACERLTGVKASDVIGTRDHWRALYDAPRPCLADLVALGRTAEMDSLYVDYDHKDEDANAAHGRKAENWCVMPQMGTRLYLAFDAGAIYDDAGKLIAVIETLRDMTVQKQAQLELQRLATHDGLTGLANRRSFDHSLQTEWMRSAREVTPLSLIMVDVDHFKRYNDTFGHQGGDACLKTIADAMAASCLRPADVMARYGGEEFAAILPSTTISGALTVAERIRAHVDALALPHPENEGVGRVSVSLGIATLIPDQSLKVQNIIEAADRALYAAKNAGRNRALHSEQLEE